MKKDTSCKHQQKNLLETKRNITNEKGINSPGRYNDSKYVCTKHQRASLVAQMVKNPPVMRETWAQSLGWEDPLEKDMATHSSILAWRIPMHRGAWWAAAHGVAKILTQLCD